MDRPITLTLAALGGQGGGVVQDWMIEVAQSAGFRVQATSVPGVAQRTGSTIYYMEFHRGSTDMPAPIMALMPVGGNCDLVVAAELLEAGRMIQRGFVDHEITTLVASTHRAYTIDEKSHLADGRANSEELLALAEASSHRFVSYDMQAIATNHGAVISAAILGAIAGAGVLPFTVEAYENAIIASGRAVATNLAAFRASLGVTLHPEPPVLHESVAVPSDGLAAGLPPEVAQVVGHALPRLKAYQDAGYVDEYRAALQPVVNLGHVELAVEVARGLALWMTFEDTIRVAELKTEPARLRQFLENDADKLVNVSDFMKPRLQELAGTMPATFGDWVLSSRMAKVFLSPLIRGLTLRTSSARGYLALRFIAQLKRYRRRTLRFKEERVEMLGWLELVLELAKEDAALALEVAACQTLIKGYGDTHANGLRNYKRIASVAGGLIGRSDAASIVRTLKQAALAEESGKELDNALEHLRAGEAA